MDKHILYYQKIQIELILSQNSVSLELFFFFKIMLWTECNFSQLLSNPNGKVLNYAQIMLTINHLTQNYKPCNCTATLNTSIFRTRIENKSLVF